MTNGGIVSETITEESTTGTAPPAVARLTDETKPNWRTWLQSMLRIRSFEDTTRDLFARNLVRGSTHLCQGQEAVVVGVAAALRRGDTMTCTYRGHGAVIAMGAPLDQCFGELLGKADGLTKGKGGSMHFAALSVGALGANAIVGAHLPMTVGAALAADYKQTGAVSVAFFGDGATNIGAFHESLNLASIWKLPAVFVLENNHYGEYSPLAATTPVERLADRAASYGMPGVYVDGNDVTAVRGTAAEAVGRARAGQGPTLVEADTYRQGGHSRSDPGAYRPPGELDRWLASDPIDRLQTAVVDRGWATAEQITELREETAREVQAALERATAWPDAAPESRFEDVWA
jgi:pyruvate dehydrogenase E1 component alpha subunit